MAYDLPQLLTNIELLQFANKHTDKSGYAPFVEFLPHIHHNARANYSKSIKEWRGKIVIFDNP